MLRVSGTVLSVTTGELRSCREQSCGPKESFPTPHRKLVRPGSPPSAQRGPTSSGNNPALTALHPRSSELRAPGGSLVLDANFRPAGRYLW